VAGRVCELGRVIHKQLQKAAFSPEIADYQLTHSTLAHLLSDQEAKEKMQK
jgi:hypothetical protein